MSWLSHEIHLGSLFTPAGRRRSAEHNSDATHYAGPHSSKDLGGPSTPFHAALSQEVQRICALSEENANLRELLADCRSLSAIAGASPSDRLAQANTQLQLDLAAAQTAFDKLTAEFEDLRAAQAMIIADAIDDQTSELSLLRSSLASLAAELERERARGIEAESRWQAEAAKVTTLRTNVEDSRRALMRLQGDLSRRASLAFPEQQSQAPTRRSSSLDYTSTAQNLPRRKSSSSSARGSGVDGAASVRTSATRPARDGSTNARLPARRASTQVELSRADDDERFARLRDLKLNKGPDRRGSLPAASATWSSDSDLDYEAERMKRLLGSSFPSRLFRTPAPAISEENSDVESNEPRDKFTARPAATLRPGHARKLSQEAHRNGGLHALALSLPTLDLHDRRHTPTLSLPTSAYRQRPLSAFPSASSLSRPSPSTPSASLHYTFPPRPTSHRSSASLHPALPSPPPSRRMSTPDESSTATPESPPEHLLTELARLQFQLAESEENRLASEMCLHALRDYIANTPAAALPTNEGPAVPASEGDNAPGWSGWLPSLGRRASSAAGVDVAALPPALAERRRSSALDAMAHSPFRAFSFSFPARRRSSGDTDGEVSPTRTTFATGGPPLPRPPLRDGHTAPMRVAYPPGWHSSAVFGEPTPTPTPSLSFGTSSTSSRSGSQSSDGQRDARLGARPVAEVDAEGGGKGRRRSGSLALGVGIGAGESRVEVGRHWTES